MLTNFYPFHILINGTSNTCHQYSGFCIKGPCLSRYHIKFSHSVSLLQSEASVLEEAKEINKEELNLKWHDINSDITEVQKQAISKLPFKMTKRCKALMRRILCFSQDENLVHLLSAWVKTMKPIRADWLSVLKEMERIENPLFTQVMEYALVEDSFQANMRDYTKLIDAYAKQKLVQNAENVLLAMKNRDVPYDQVTLTVLIHMYSKAGDLNRAEEIFEEIKLLGLPMDKRAYGSMIMAYIRAGSLDLAEELMRETEAQETYAGKEVYKALLRAYSTIGDADGAQRVFDGIQLAGIVPDSRLCALLINAYCVAGKSDNARSVLANMKSAGVVPSDKCVALMLGAYEKENNLQAALSFLMDLEKYGIVVAEEAAGVLAGWFRRLGVVHEVEHVLQDFTVRDGGI